jgi:hypothetical protein
MTAPGGTPEDIFGKLWVHVFEQDTPQGAVFRPEDGPIPLSRRPREAIELGKDGSARILVPGPDDRFVERVTTWREEGGDVVIRGVGGIAALRIVERSPERLVVRGLRQKK